VETAQLHTEVQEHAALPILAVRGEIDVYTAPLFKQAVQKLLTEGTRHLIIDMQGVTYMDSSGFGTLLGATKRLRPEGGALHLVGTNPTVSRMLHLTRLDTVLALHPTMEDALGAAQEPASFPTATAA
jgi:anti-sigma B factor antagonist